LSLNNTADRRLLELEDRLAITDVLYRLAHHVDQNERELWLGLFTDPARFRAAVRRSAGASDAPYEFLMDISGIEALREWNSSFHPEGESQMNIISQPLITIRGEEADAKTYFHRVLERNGQREIASHGRYIDRLVRCVDGRWRMADRIAEIGSVAAK
jgi:hypothetical protein